MIADWKHGPHRLTYRQTERTFGLAADALAKDEPDGLPSGRLPRICDGLLEASVPEEFKDASTSLAVDWTDMESFSRPPPARGGPCADPEASWGHRKNNLLRSEDELFFGYYLSASHHDARRERPGRPRTRPPHDPVLLPPRPGPRLRPRPDRDAGRRHRVSATSSPTPATPTATPAPGRSRSARPGRQLVQDLHPHDRGPKGTHHGAIIANGNLYCPKTPRTLLELGPLARSATPEDAAAHDARTAELARYKLGRITGDDADGYHRVACPAAMGKIRCPLRPPSMTLDRDRPGDPAARRSTPRPAAPSRRSPSRRTCCAKTAQKHDYPSAAHRRSYARRTGAERGFATAKDPATNDISRGWCRLMGLTPLMLFTTTLLIVRNQRILAAWDARQAENARRAAAGLPPKTRQTPPQDTRPPRHSAALAREHTRTPGQHPPRHPGSPGTPHADSGSTPANRPGHTESHQAHTNRTRHDSSHGHARTHTGMSDPNVNMVPTET